LENLRSFWVGFVPLLLFIFIDAFWGMRYGVVVALVYTFFEFIRQYVKEKKFDKILFIDAILITFLGSISFFLDDDRFFKFKPVIMQIMMMGFLFVVKFKPQIIESYMERFTKNSAFVQISYSELKQIVTVTLVVIFFHTFYLAYVSLEESDALWAFTAGPLFYILMFSVFIFFFFYRKFEPRIWQIFKKNEEWLPIINKKGEILFSAPRSVAHKRGNFLHPTVHLLIINDKKVFLQKRSQDKSVYPNRWDSSVGGHVEFGESIEAALIRETEEELGFKLEKAEFLGNFYIEDEYQSEMVYLFTSFTKNKIKYNRKEIADGRFFSKKEIFEEDQKKFTPHLLKDEVPRIEKYLK
jgi:isopentenyldiphosphate isomerase/intracellular septation protein A